MRVYSSQAKAETEVLMCERRLEHQWHPLSALTCALHLISYRRGTDENRANETED